jgi:hypothetical protein
VGAVGYLVGGGAGLLGRRFGFVADHVRRLSLVTADGRLREVTAEDDHDLFGAVRGGKNNIIHLRFAYSGDAADGERLVRRLRDLGPVVLDTVRDMPYAEVDTIHHEPTSTTC